MRNSKQLLMDFYLELLKLPNDHDLRLRHQNLYGTVRNTLAYQLMEDEETIQRIFERMANEDGR